MMIKTMILICSLVTLGGVQQLNHAQTEMQERQAHERWLGERYVEALSIKEGMTRAELNRLFRMDGGLHEPRSLRYVLNSCSLIKVNVEFDGATDEQRVYSDEAKIKTISKPYLEPSNTD